MLKQHWPPYQYLGYTTRDLPPAGLWSQPCGPGYSANFPLTSWHILEFGDKLNKGNISHITWELKVFRMQLLFIFIFIFSSGSALSLTTWPLQENIEREKRKKKCKFLNSSERYLLNDIALLLIILSSVRDIA